MSLKGLPVWMVVWLVFVLVVVVNPFFTVIVVGGSKPRNENWASFFGPSIDSSR
jgi:hypothetical protein